MVRIALEWQESFSVAPSITTAISEYDVAVRFLGMEPVEYAKLCQGKTAVQRHVDIVDRHGISFQVKANRPSGGPGSEPTITSAKPSNLNCLWNGLFWVLYHMDYSIRECWFFAPGEFSKAFEGQKYVRPARIRQTGHDLTHTEPGAAYRYLHPAVKKRHNLI